MARAADSVLKRAAATGPAFGDSNWVAPYPVATEELTPDGTGPRVAEKNGEALGETILRAPFRVVFFPLKAVFRGLEWGAGKVEALAEDRLEVRIDRDAPGDRLAVVRGIGQRWLDAVDGLAELASIAWPTC